MSFIKSHLVFLCSPPMLSLVLFPCFSDDPSQSSSQFHMVFSILYPQRYINNDTEYAFLSANKTVRLIKKASVSLLLSQRGHSCKMPWQMRGGLIKDGT